MKQLKTRLKEARKKIGHRSLAHAIGISLDSLQLFISGKKPRQMRVIRLIKEYLERVGL